MSDGAWELQSALYETLTNDADLIAALGSQKIFDHVPERAEYPFLVLGTVTSLDLGASPNPNTEHTLNLTAFDRGGGRNPVIAIAQIVRQLLHCQSIALIGHTLINCQVPSIETARDAKTSVHRARLRVRAVTEPLV